MLRGADGELKWDEPNGYLCTTLNKHQFNGQHWNSFLNVIYQNLSSELNKDGKKIIDLANYGENLNILNPISSLAATGTGFMVDKFGWNGALSFWITSAIICIVICVILWKNERKSAC